MSTFTPALALEKPDPIENVDVDILNANADKVDAAFAGIVSSFRNKIRNGDMSVAQRGNGPFTSDGYSIDGYRREGVGGSFSVSRVSAALGTAFGVNGAKYALQAAISGQSTAGHYAVLVQKIEDVRTLAGKEVTLSFIAAADTGTPKIGIEIGQVFGTGGSPSAAVSTVIGTVTLSTIPTKYSITFIVPNITGKTLGTNNDDYLAINFWLSAGSTFAASSSNIGIQNVTFTLTDIQLETGAVATAFERLPPHVQLAWCQRYLWVFSHASGGQVVAQGFMVSTATCRGTIPGMTVPLRATPSVVGFTGGFIVWDGVTNTPLNTIGIAYFTTSSPTFDFNGAAAVLTAGRYAIVYLNGGSSGSMTISAEL